MSEPRYQSDTDCPFNNHEPCNGIRCPKWKEVLPAYKDKSSLGNCTAVVYIRENREERRRG